MPLGFERVNERTQRPNALINFIKPLPGPHASVAENILNRVAAICYPFMKSNMILVQALEEFPYNREFVGRNFNAGEVIQLVLKDRNGRWLPQRMVEMVMVHELAHCKQMNHSKAFWKVRDAYAADLRGLWARHYSGEGMWGRGRNLESGGVQADSVDVHNIPEHLCGGTYGRKSKKRRRNARSKEMLSYAERKQRRILKKFGTGGQALGADDETKIKLEGGAVKKGKPRVAGSARGRDLRAAAALARFESSPKEPAAKVETEELPSDSDTDEEYDEPAEEEAAVDVDGKKLVDSKGRTLVKICEDEDKDDGEARREMDEIHAIELDHGKEGKDKGDTGIELPKQRPVEKTSKAHSASSNSSSRSPANKVHRPIPSTSCPLCSLINEPGSATCSACSHVLAPRLVPDHWKCSKTMCKGSEYINSGDIGICGICGLKR
ncbi:WLM-domain-containing protein [Corynespora cassiicola Philippines]|uniref:WLM-domain-containing protein n=1 Tax=Corynespora cassiicola Philippines TaxID=1448308 RepID=A0A2T2NBD1_CORCC|nr:WLM-domain-containing protein [Corynespora cassiicola Philippines]